jgi:hypothetical protein
VDWIGHLPDPVSASAEPGALVAFIRKTAALPDEPPHPQSLNGLQINHNSFLIHTLVITGLDPVIRAISERRVDDRIKSGHDEDGWSAFVDS